MNLYEVKEKVLEYLDGLGFQEKDKAYYILRDLLDKCPDRPGLLLTILKACGESYSPDNGLLNLSHYIDHSLSPYSQIKELAENEALLKVAVSVFSASNYLSSLLIIRPALLNGLFENGFLSDPEVKNIKKEAFRFIDDFKEDDHFLEAINAFKVKYILLIALRELFKLDTINETTLKLSILADTIIETIYKRNQRNYPDKNFAVISMGKLGSNEVNFSSDLDLIFISKQAADPELIQFGTKVIADLTHRSRFGYLYRIDMRLRPEGHASYLVTHYDYFADYLSGRARTWERQAYLRARFSAGDPESAELAMKAIKQFVYKSALTIEDIRSIIFIKNEIDISVKANPMGHVKKGRGGIRDIEFIAQAFQLIFGEQMKDLRNPNIFYTLERIYNHELISHEEYDVLKTAYILLRRVEHYLQLRENRQVFQLPEKESELNILSRLMDYPGPDELKKDYSSLREQVRNIFTRVFSRVFGEGEIAPISEIVMNPDVEEKFALSELNKYGFKDSKNIFKYLRKITEMSPRIRISLALSLNYILEEIKDCSDPDKKLFNLFGVIEAYGAISIFLKLIRYRPEWRKILMNVIAESDTLSLIVMKNPGIIDAFIDPESLRSSDAPETLFPLIMEMVGNDHQRAIEKMKNHQFFKTAIREFSGEIDSERAGIILSDTIDYSISEAIKHQLNENTQEYAVLSLGRLGCREITFRSDADVIYLCGGKKSDFSSYVRFFNSLRDYLKKVIELDPRLRPDGKNAPVAVSFEGFDDYLDNKGSLWEKVAYMKARVLASSDENIKKHLENKIREFVLSGDNNYYKKEINELRNKIHSAYTKPNQFNIKKDSGGLLDIDFILFLAIREKNVKNWGYSVISNLQLPELNDLKNSAGLSLLEIYRFYRKTENILRVYEAGGKSVLNLNDEKHLSRVAKRLGLESGKELQMKINEYRDFIISFL